VLLDLEAASNFQHFTNQRDVKDRSDADLTQEPKMSVASDGSRRESRFPRVLQRS